MVEPITINIRHLSQDVRIPQEQVQAAVDLLDAGFPIPFIARYRSEATQNLNEESLRRIDDELRSVRFLCERKLAILRTIESAGKLTPDLDQSIRDAKTFKRLEDLHLPFKPKRQNAAAAARENGLEPLALEIIEGTLPADKLDERAIEFINADKKIKSVADVLLGTGHIIADIFACKAELVQKVRDILYQHGHLTGTKVESVEQPTGKDGRQKSADKKDKRQPRAADASPPVEETVAEANKADNENGVTTFEPVPDPNEPEIQEDHIDQTEVDTDVAIEDIADLADTPTIETADDGRQTVADSEGIAEESITSEASPGVPESEMDGTKGPEGEEGMEGTEGTESEEKIEAIKEPDVIEATESTEEETKETVETVGTTEEPLLPSASPADLRPPLLPAEDDAQEVTELFQQFQEEQAEKGIPVVQSQNSIKKKKKAEARKKQEEIKQRQREHFGRQFVGYFDFSIKLRGVPAHHILSLNRGERHKAIQVDIKIDEAKLLESVKEICVPTDHPHAEFLTGCLKDALQRNILPMLVREIRDDMTEYAEKNVIKIFGYNLRNQLLQRPLHQKRVLALDPSQKSGCKAVVLDEFGNLLGHETIFIAQSKDRREASELALAEMIRKFGITIIAIGGGGGSRPVEESVAHMIETHFSGEHSADADLVYAIVNKSGTIAYSTSLIAKEELPGEDPFVRAAISVGRRLQNPLTELVKVDPVSLGLFHHDIRGKYVRQMLTDVVESCVNFVGVDVNLATPAILTHIAGLNQMTARRICEYRREHGQFRTREDLKKVPGINETVYTHSAGFLRVTGGDNPLDSTNIHPESYELAANILEKLGFSANDLRSGEKVKAIADKIASEKFGELTIKLSSEFKAGLDTVRDILGTFSRLAREPHGSLLSGVFRRAAIKLESLTPGTELTGTVLNVTDFGAFVDIGLHESGFVHISQMASGYIQSAHERVIAGNTLRLWVVEADVAKKRVSLTLLPPGTEKQSPRSTDKKEQERPPRERPPRPPRPEGERREFSEKPRGERPVGERPPFKGARDGKRFERRDSKSFDRAPKTFVTAPIKKEAKPITEDMKKGKEPMRSFSDLAQLFGRASGDTEDKPQQ